MSRDQPIAKGSDLPLPRGNQSMSWGIQDENKHRRQEIKSKPKPLPRRNQPGSTGNQQESKHWRQ